MKEAHGIDFLPTYEIIRNGVIIEHRKDNEVLPQESKIIIQDTARPEHDVIELPFRSFVNNLIKWVGLGCGNMGNCVSYNGSGINHYAFCYGSNNLNSATDTTGLQVGTKATAVSPSNSSLTGLILEGTATGKLNKNVTVRNAIDTSNSNSQFFTFTRQMLNNSGTNITNINEIGVMWTSGYGGQYSTFFTRDVFPSAVRS